MKPLASEQRAQAGGGTTDGAIYVPGVPLDPYPYPYPDSTTTTTTTTGGGDTLTPTAVY